MTSYDDTKVQLTINRMTEECYENVPSKSSTELYLISHDPTSIAKIDLDAQSRTDAEISSIQSDMNALQSDLNDLSTEVSDISANLTHSTVRRWEYVEYKGLTFTAEEANSTVAMQKVGSAPDVSLEYSTGNGWNDFIVGETTVALPNIGDQMVMRAKTTNTTFGNTASTRHQFVMTGKVAASDSIMYLLKSDGELDDISGTWCFTGMFNDCSSLTSAPDLPATTLSQGCYSNMFKGCNSLTQSPELPATIMAHGCYSYMFSECNSLTDCPELPSTELAPYCYADMFYKCARLSAATDLPASVMADDCYAYMFMDCSSLQTAPELSATTLANGCYLRMFSGTSLTQSPELPATTLATNCYGSMFRGCTSLTQSPELPATTLANSCYTNMFNGCSSLNTIKIGYTGNFSGTGVPTDAFNNWVQGVSASGTFYYDGEDTTTGASAIPTGWEVRGNTWPGLTFTAEEANSTVAMTAVRSAPSVSLEYSTDGTTWSDFIVGTTTVTLANVGDKMVMRAKTTNIGMGSDILVYNKFRMTGKIAASGSIMYLLKNDGDLDTISEQYCFNSLFADCSSLTTAPELPATTLSDACYNGMFFNCTSLTSAPELPATTLADGCYAIMFCNCTSLTQAPELPATTLAKYCYQNMFNDCTSLNEIKIAYTGNFTGTGVPNYAFTDWVQGVSASGTFYYNGSDTRRGNSAIPTNWTVQTF